MQNNYKEAENKYHGGINHVLSFNDTQWLNQL